VKSGRKESVRSDRRISRAADGLKLGKALFDQRKGRKRGVRFGLIQVVIVIKERRQEVCAIFPACGRACGGVKVLA